MIPAPPPVDIAKPPPVHITSPPPVHFTRAPPLDFSRDSKVPVLTHESNVEISDIEPQVGILIVLPMCVLFLLCT